MKHNCSNGYIKNPKSGQNVLMFGKTGIKLLRDDFTENGNKFSDEIIDCIVKYSTTQDITKIVLPKDIQTAILSLQSGNKESNEVSQRKQKHQKDKTDEIELVRQLRLKNIERLRPKLAEDVLVSKVEPELSKKIIGKIGKFTKLDFKPIDVNMNVLKGVPDGYKPKFDGAMITLDAFDHIIEGIEFIDRYRESLVELYKHKYKVYSDVEFLPGQPPEKEGKSVSIYERMRKRIEELLSKITKPSFNEELQRDLKDAIHNDKYGMLTLIGREAIMNKICGILFAFSRRSSVLYKLFINFAIMGSAGVGKSALAKVLAFIFKKSYILLEGTVTIATQQELMGEYIGQSQPKTRRQLLKAVEGVLFIDEAYSLTPCPEERHTTFYTGEVLSELINFIDKTIGLQVVIVAGYKDKMLRCFFPANEGLDRRFPYKFLLKEYNSNELTIMLINNLIDNEMILSPDIHNLLYSIVDTMYRRSPEVFKNQAGDMLNLGNFIVQSSLMCTDIEWGHSPETDSVLVYAGVEQFLINKGFHTEPLQK